ncbi:MAG: ABC transporter permease subunit [Bacteroidales bacterium]|nr:ABC transporter permease subunit [Bacteroidales bacterium]
MKNIWIITKKELSGFFDSLMAYIMLIAFLGFSGLFTWLYLADIFLINQASMMAFFAVAFWTLFFFIPAMTMKSLAEENRTGTLEFLLTKPISITQLIAGKFLATLLLIVIALVLTLPYYITIASIGQIDHGAVWCGYFGLILMSCAYIGIGVFASSISNNQIVAFLTALVIGIFFHFLFGLLSSQFTGFFSSLFNYLDAGYHFESMARGVIDSKDVVYFLSIAFLGLTGAKISIEKKQL